MTNRAKYRLEVGFLLSLAAIVAVVEAIVVLTPIVSAIRRAF